MIDAPVSCVAAANCETLEQVLRHLVQNALDASEADSGIEIRASAIGFEAVIEVIDFGCGMSAEFMRTGLFKPFVSTKPGGFGIGAFESRELVQAMRGRLEVESREGLGSRFIVRLPLARKDGVANHFAALDLQTSGNRPMPAPTHRKVA